MRPKKDSSFWSRMIRECLIVTGVLALLLSLPVYISLSLGYTESKGPFKNATQVVDLDGDGDLDVLISHTRWEGVDLSWAGIGMWINQGDGTFKLLRDRGTGEWQFNGFAAGAGDVDQDGDVDVFTQDFAIRLMVNQGGVQGGEPGKYAATGGIDTPPAYNQGYRDMGGTITMGDLNGDGKVDALVAGCCYGMDARKPGNNSADAPSVSWVWINDGWEMNVQSGHTLALDFLDGRPIRQAALGDVDGDGDLDVFAAIGKPTLGRLDPLDNLILLNDGTGRLAVLDQTLGGTDSTSVALGDVNGDGRLDALVGTSTAARLWINHSNEMGKGGPNFVPTQQLFEARQTFGGKLQAGFSAAASKLGLYLPYGSVRTKSVNLADLDGDGDLDALLGRLWGAEVWWNAGQGEFERSEMRFEYREDTGVAVADFDGDGDQDIFAGGNDDHYQVWWNNGKGVMNHQGSADGYIGDTK